MTRFRPSPIRARAIAAAFVGTTALALAGCHAERAVHDAYPTTYQQRHPIVLTEGMAKLDLPTGAGRDGLTSRQKEDIRAFVRDWRANGRGPVAIMLPQGGSSDAAAAYSARAIRASLAASGVPATEVLSQRYSAQGPDHLAPVRLVYAKLKAEVPHPCGLWPDDLGHGGGDLYGATQNREYWNFGCATQQNLAAQVADPEDLARPRAETPVYAARRQSVIQKHRLGEDPSTKYDQENAQVSDVAND